MINTAQEINLLLQKYHTTFADVVSFNPSEEHFINLDFTANNQDLLPETVNNTHKFSEYIDGVLARNNAKFGIGGYFEHRTIYARSEHFGNSEEEPRRLHLGVDIWGKVNTPVFAFADAQVHSYAFNDNFGDYGATIILKYEIDDLLFYALYGHLSLASLTGLVEGQFIPAGKQFATFGVKEENGYWPPHLHFQLIFDIPTFQTRARSNSKLTVTLHKDIDIGVDL